MAIYKRASWALVLGGVLLAGCAEGNENIFTTGSLTGGSQTGAADTKADPACMALASRIEALRKDGIPEKIEKAAAKHYRMTQADLAKADQLTKTNADFQAHCSTVKLPVTADTPPPSDTSPKASTKKTAKASTTAKTP